MPTSKVATFIGFAVKSRKSRTGMNAVQTLKAVKLMLVCRSASENSVKETKKIANKFRCALYTTTQKDLSEYVYKPNVKVMAITDEALAKAIIENCGEELQELPTTEKA